MPINLFVSIELSVRVIYLKSALLGGLFPLVDLYSDNCHYNQAKTLMVWKLVEFRKHI